MARKCRIIVPSAIFLTIVVIISILYERESERESRMRKTKEGEFPLSLPHGIIDPHFHIFDIQNGDYLITNVMKYAGWMKYKYLQLLFKLIMPAHAEAFGEAYYMIYDYLPTNYYTDARGMIVYNLHVEAYHHNFIKETHALIHLNHTYNMPYAFISGADLQHPFIYNELKLQKSLGVRGIRARLAHDNDPLVPSFVKEGIYRNKEWRAGISKLAELGLVMDVWGYHPQLPQIIELAKIYSNTTIVLNHCGTPLGIGHYANDQSKVQEEWKANMKELSKYPNVYVKLSGLGIPITGVKYFQNTKSPTSDVIKRDFSEIIHYIVDIFGSSRSMFASNFPVDKISFPFTTLYNAYIKISEKYAPQQQKELFYSTARKVYNLTQLPE